MQALWLPGLMYSGQRSFSAVEGRTAVHVSAPSFCGCLPRQGSWPMLQHWAVLLPGSSHCPPRPQAVKELPEFSWNISVSCQSDVFITQTDGICFKVSNTTKLLWEFFNQLENSLHSVLEFENCFFGDCFVLIFFKPMPATVFDQKALHQ